MTTFGDWLRSKRKARRLTQEELAVDAHLNRTYINAIENGRVQLPTADTREKLHRVLGTSDQDLISAGLLVVDEYGLESLNSPLVNLDDEPGVDPNALKAEAHRIVDLIDWETSGSAVSLTGM